MIGTDDLGGNMDEEEQFLLNPGAIWPSRLKNIECTEQKGLVEQAFDGSKLVQYAEFRHLEKPKSILNVRMFTEEMRRLGDRGNGTKTPNWFRFAIEMVLSADQLKLVLDGALDDRFSDYHILSDPNHPTSLLYVNTRHQPIETQRSLDDILGPKAIDSLPIQLAPANADYAIEITQDDMPFRLRGDDHESKMMIFLETKYLADKPEPTCCMIRHLEDEFDVGIRHRRVLTSHEKKWLATWHREPSLEHQEISILEFYEMEDRNKLSRRVEHVPLYIVDGVIDEKKMYDEAFVQIFYDLRMTRVHGIRVFLHLEEDINRAGHHFRKLGVKVEWKVKRNVIELLNLPAHLQNEDDKSWFVKKICRDNEIRFETLEPMWLGRNTATVPTEEELLSKIDRRLLNICQFNRGLMPLRDVLAREIDLTDAPWFKTSRMVEPHQLSITCYFETAEKGLRILKEVMNPMTRRNLSVDTFVPEFTPVYRRFFSISRAMRVVFSAKIAEFDESIRFKFFNLAEQNDKVMEKPSSYHCALRVFERWEDGEQRGFIGVEGWEPAVVQMYVEELRKVLEPVKFDGCMELLQGIGELYAKQLEKKRKVLIDVDKFHGEISIFGDDAGSALDDLRNYSRLKTMIEVDVTINGRYFNDIEFLRDRHLWQNSGIFGCQWFYHPYEKTIQFSGTLEIYEKLIGALYTYSENSMKRCLERRDSTVELACPVCTCKIEDDWVRQTCGHLMCRDCANAQFRADAQARRFCCKFCQMNWAPMDLKNLILGGDTRLPELDFQKLQSVMPIFHQALLNIRNLDIRSCPTPDCLGIRRPGPAEQRCSICSHDYCGACLEPRAANHICAPPGGGGAPVDEPTRRYISTHTMECSACGAAVERTDGCDHIACVCGAHFCYLCGYNAPAQRDVYDHLNDVHGTDVHVLMVHEGRMFFNNPEMEMEHIMAMHQLQLFGQH